MRHRQLLYVIAAMALLPFMVTGDSLWMDEGNTAVYAMEPSFHAWLSKLLQDGGADCQMPLGNFFAWVGGNLIGVDEWQIRAINIFWGILTLFFMARIGRRLDLPWLPLFFALQPFFWFYTNEARPYSPQIAFGAMMLLSFVQFIQERGQGRLWPWTFTVASIFLCCSTMIAPAQMAATAIAAGIMAIHNGWKVERRAYLVILLGMLLLLPLGYYYYETLVRGAKGVQIWKIDFRYLVYIPYEISGSLGLGPSVVHLRELALGQGGHIDRGLILQCAMAFSLLAVVSVILFMAIWNRRRDENKYLLPIFLPFFFEVMVLFVVGILIHKAFWPRHYSAAFPYYVTALALAVRPLWISPSRFGKVLPLLMLGLLLAGVFGIRFGAEHRKEDYRWAASQALAYVHQGKEVWWCGAGAAANYYGITFDQRVPGQGVVFILTNRHWDGILPYKIAGLEAGAPDEILISRADVHDDNGNVRKMIREKGYHLEETRGSFEQWVR